MYTYDVILNCALAEIPSVMANRADLGDRLSKEPPYLGEVFQWIVNCKLMDVTVVQVVDYTDLMIEGWNATDLLKIKNNSKARGAVLIEVGGEATTMRTWEGEVISLMELAQVVNVPSEAITPRS